MQLYFTTADGKQDRHVLEIEAYEIRLRAAVMSKVHLELLMVDEDFNVAG